MMQASMKPHTQVAYEAVQDYQRHALTDNTSRPKGSLSNKIDVLASVLCNAEDSLETLAKFLEPVILPQDPRPECSPCTGTAIQPASPMERNIDHLIDRVRALIEREQDILRRLSL